MRYEQLWAPWRLPYIQGEPVSAETPENLGEYLSGADTNCFLCQGVAATNLRDPGTMRDHPSDGARVADGARPNARARYVVHRSPTCLTMLNRYPYNNGHLLVAPQLHRARLDDLTPAEQSDLLQEIIRMVSLLEKVLSPQGFNVGLNLGPAAGAGLPGHLHWHIVPRWNGDTNFMPALAAVKVIPQALDALWEELTRAVGT